jgi:hypothetical protein
LLRSASLNEGRSCEKNFGRAHINDLPGNDFKKTSKCQSFFGPRLGKIDPFFETVDIYARGHCKELKAIT